MERYDNNTTLTSTQGKRYLSSTLYPSIGLSEDDLYIYTVKGDRLDNLAYQFYKDPTLWWILSTANPPLPNDSLHPPVGYQLRIPTNVTQILRDFESLNK